ncbi:MAG TPA: hypothetical protein VFS87_03960 [Qipengyuania sp.]|nr:hypothetical protein [Qipengyuania sp.]
MSFVILALLVAFTAATALVLADSGLRLWSAVGGLKAPRLAVASGDAAMPQPGMRAARMTTRVSYPRSGSVRSGSLRAAA